MRRHRDSAVDLVDVEDVLFEIDNKPTHRPDCWGHRGIAQVAALRTAPQANESRGVLHDRYADHDRPKAPDACPRYLAIPWTTWRLNITLWPMLLRRVGIRAINNAVDATNFVMLDWVTLSMLSMPDRSMTIGFLFDDRTENLCDPR